MNYDIIILGAGAAGMMCAIEAGKRHKKVLVLEKSSKPGRKILMSGGGRCNFTNLNIHPDCYLSRNPHFAKSALSRYTQWDFIEMVKRHKIPFHEKTLGQLFCDHKASDIVDMLLAEMKQYSVKLCLESDITQITKTVDGFVVTGSRLEGSKDVRTMDGKASDFCEQKSLPVLQEAKEMKLFRREHRMCVPENPQVSILQSVSTKCLVIATGGLTVPSMGSSPLAYHIAEQFGLNILPTRAGLVPVTWHVEDKERFALLSGISVENVTATVNKKTFKESLLFTHRGLSGPALLQISSYWQPGEAIDINFLPNMDVLSVLKAKQQTSPKVILKTVLSSWFAQRFLTTFFDENLLNQRLADINHKIFHEIAQQLQHWQVKPNGTEGYRTAEVTLGGIDTDELSSKTLESKKVSGLFFIGEAVDVTGWLGGYNFQWAWSSGWAAGRAV